jgi:predicted enzyme related to lactoylglutathione lyase
MMRHAMPQDDVVAPDLDTPHRKETPMKLSGILIGSDDPHRLVDYYTRLFGEPGMTDDPYTGWMFGEGWVVVGPHSEVAGRNASPGRLIWNLEVADVPAEAARLTEAGAIVVAAPYEMGDQAGAWIATFEDPDGNLFQLMAPMEM